LVIQMTDDQGRPWRWGTPLSRADAEALARRWEEGDVISEPERYERLKDWIQEQVGHAINDLGYGTLREVREYMAEQGISELTTDADPRLVQNIVCEETCAKEVGALGLKGPDMDAAFWTCMHQCSPVIFPETLDQDDPMYPHSDYSEDEFTTTFSIPERSRLARINKGDDS
jgi:hypothetical protein